MEAKNQTGVASVRETVSWLRQQLRRGDTVGYGERFPEADVAGLVVKDNNSATGIQHTDQEAAVGYDTTKFGNGNLGVKRFLRVLSAVSLDVVEDYIRVFRDLGRGFETNYQDRYLHVWVNGGVLVACSNNPITGQAHSLSHKVEFGHAGSIGVGGNEQLVQRAVAQIDARATSKDKRHGGLFF